MNNLPSVKEGEREGGWMSFRRCAEGKNREEHTREERREEEEDRGGRSVV